MTRILQRKKIVKLQFVLATVTIFAMSLAVCSVLFMAWTWEQTREVSLTLRTLKDHLGQVNAQQKAVFQHLLDKRGKLNGQRVKRNGERTKKSKKGKKVASHFKKKGTDVGSDGIIKDWSMEHLNVSKAVTYDPNTGTFKVGQDGVYFLYCQVHFNESQSTYVKLDVFVDDKIALQCMEGFRTPMLSSGHMFQSLKPCQVLGLVQLKKDAELKVATAPNFTLLPNEKHYFGLFKVN